MHRTAILTATLAFALVSAAGGAQTSSKPPDASYGAAPLPPNAPAESYRTATVPAGRPLAPFSTDVLLPGSARQIEFRSEAQMSAQDRDLATGAQSSIRQDAELAGMEFDKGKWAYRQLVCQAIPGHLFLLFERDNGAGDVSLFSAAVPRGNKGRVRVIPVERRGFSLFSPASVNPITISAFNHIRADEPQEKSPDWLATALCYAALAGAHPMTSPPPEESAGANPALVFPPTLEVGAGGESTVRFVEVAAWHRPMQWILAFDAKGQLLKVTKFATPVYEVTPINPLPTPQPSAQNR
ncbi:MAG: hypothetical protein ABSF23_01705 [Terracidiphilus sp.]|jgi:hypothetical protein